MPQCHLEPSQRVRESYLLMWRDGQDKAEGEKSNCLWFYHSTRCLSPHPEMSMCSLCIDQMTWRHLLGNYNVPFLLSPSELPWGAGIMIPTLHPWEFGLGDVRLFAKVTGTESGTCPSGVYSPHPWPLEARLLPATMLACAWEKSLENHIKAATDPILRGRDGIKGPLFFLLFYIRLCHLSLTLHWAWIDFVLKVNQVRTLGKAGLHPVSLSECNNKS